MPSMVCCRSIWKNSAPLDRTQPFVLLLLARAPRNLPSSAIPVPIDLPRSLLCPDNRARASTRRRAPSYIDTCRGRTDRRVGGRCRSPRRLRWRPVRCRRWEKSVRRRPPPRAPSAAVKKRSGTRTVPVSAPAGAPVRPPACRAARRPCLCRQRDEFAAFHASASRMLQVAVDQRVDRADTSSPAPSAWDSPNRSAERPSRPPPTGSALASAAPGLTTLRLRRRAHDGAALHVGALVIGNVIRAPVPRIGGAALRLPSPRQRSGCTLVTPSRPGSAHDRSNPA